MTPAELAPVTLMIEMRERLVRIETKMDAATEKVDGHESRLSTLEATAAQLRSTIGTLKWLGGSCFALAGFVGLDRLAALVQ